MAIPSCIKLDERQIALYERWAKYLVEHEQFTIQRHDEEFGGAVMTSPFQWRIQETGICTIIKVNGLGATLDLTIDDDGELMGSIVEEDW